MTPLLLVNPLTFLGNASGVRGLPYMTSALRGEGGQKIPQFCGPTVHQIRTKGERGGNPKILQTSYIEAP